MGGAVLISEGLIKFAVALFLFPLMTLLGAICLLGGKKTWQRVIQGYLAIQYLMVAFVTFLLKECLLWISGIAFPFIIYDRWKNGCKVPKFWVHSFFLLFLGTVLTAISGFMGLRATHSNLGFADLAMWQMFAVMMLFAHLLEKRIISIHSILSGLVWGGVLFTALVYVDAAANSALFSGKRLGDSTFVNPNILACQLDVLLPLSLALFMKETSIKRWGWLLVSVLFFVSILATISRGSLPGIVITAFMLLWWNRKSKAFLVLSSSLFMVAMIFAGPVFVNRILSHSSSDMGSNMSRLILLRAALMMAQSNHYVFGSGMDNFASMKYSFGVPLSLNPDKAMSSHNMYMEVVLGWGVIALIGWMMLFWGTSLKLMFGKLTSQEKIHPQGISCALMAFMLHGFVDSSLANQTIFIQICLLLACAAVLLKSKQLA